MSEIRTLKFTVAGDPVAKGRPIFNYRTAGRPHAITPEKTAKYENLVRLSFIQKFSNHEPIDTDLELTIESYFKIPESWSKTRKKMAANGDLAKITKPDLDNVVKAISDGLNGVAWTDDSRIVGIFAVKRYTADAPRVEVSIKYKEE